VVGEMNASATENSSKVLENLLPASQLLLAMANRQKRVKNTSEVLLTRKWEGRTALSMKRVKELLNWVSSIDDTRFVQAQIEESRRVRAGDPPGEVLTLLFMVSRNPERLQLCAGCKKNLVWVWNKRRGSCGPKCSVEMRKPTSEEERQELKAEKRDYQRKNRAIHDQFKPNGIRLRAGQTKKTRPK